MLIKILKKIFFFLINFIPNKNLRHKLRDSFNYHFYLDVIPIYVIKKKKSFLKNLDKYATIAIGSSHCEFAFNPEYIDSPSFNFGISSADNFMMYELYRNFIKKSKIKNVIAFYSIFSSGSNNIYTKDFKYQFLPLKYILNFNYEQENNNLKKLCSKYYNSITANEDNDNGYIPSNTGFYNKNMTIEERCESHLKIHNKNCEDKWILKLAQECVQDGKNFIFVISPAQHIYKKNMPSSAVLFNDIITKIKEITPFAGEKYNFYNTDIFEDENLWADADHLNNNGSKAFTKELNKILKEDKLI